MPDPTNPAPLPKTGDSSPTGAPDVSFKPLNEPINEKITTISEPTPGEKKPKKSNTTLALVGLLLIVIALPGAVLLARQRQLLQKRAATPDVCNNVCTSDSDCAEGFACQLTNGSGLCRNPDCVEEVDCDCTPVIPTIIIPPATPTSSFGIPTQPPGVPSPTPGQGSCNSVCYSDLDCPATFPCNLTNGSGFCRNPACQNEADCICPSVPTPAPTLPGDLCGGIAVTDPNFDIICGSTNPCTNLSPGQEVKIACRSRFPVGQGPQTNYSLFRVQVDGQETVKESSNCIELPTAPTGDIYRWCYIDYTIPDSGGNFTITASALEAAPI